jgi:hypothetical protein
MASALTRAMIRKGLLEDSDIADAADELEAAGEQTAAHVMRCAAIEAKAPAQSDWNADRARKRFRLIEGGEE